MTQASFILYRIYYGDTLVYLGRTKQPLQDRIRGHLFKKPMMRSIDIGQVSKIEYAEFKSEADMNLYEIYFINLWKPPLNIDDKCKDKLTVQLPFVQWKTFETQLWEKWRKEITDKDSQREHLADRNRRITEEIRILRNTRKMGSITDDAYWNKYDELKGEYDSNAKLL